MSKLGWLVIILLVAGLLYTGIVDINFNREKLGSLPDVTSSILSERSTYEEARALSVKIKRKGEQLIVQNKEKRLVLALLYVRTDSSRLQELIDKNQDSQNAALLLPQSELLLDSLDRVRLSAEKAPVSVVAELKGESEEAFSDAQLTLRNLQALHDDYQEIGDEFSRLTESLESQIGNFNLAEDEHAGEVAGTQDDKPDEDNSNSEEVPLEF